jgi:acetylornithine deacetylase/succinyl-diaminopimelate desuccinylase-like protein
LPFRSTATFVTFFALIADALGLPPEQRRLSEQNLRRALTLVPADMGHYLRALTHDTAVPTGLRAGHKINVIPGQAEAWVDGRYLPGQTAEGFLEEVRRVIGTGYEIDRLDTTVPLEDPPDGPLYQTIVSVMARHAPKATVAPLMLAGATDAKHVCRLGTRCLGFGPIRIPEGFPLEHLIHGHDERVPIDGFVWGVQVLYDVVTAFCR